MPIPTLRPLAALLCLCAMLACRSTPEQGAPGAQPDTAAEATSKPYDPRMWEKGPPDPLGAYLAELDKTMRAWTNLTLTAQSPSERNKARDLQKILMRRVHERQTELVDCLQSGPPRNRVIAAGALGFSASPEVIGPLVVALSDKQNDVVQNSALSLALLQNVETPMAPVLEVFQGNPNGLARANAGYAVRTILEAGAAPSEDIVKAARRALIDDEPFAQAQGALILAVCMDGDSVPDLGELLASREPLVVGAATQALLSLGRRDPKLLGPTGRALVVGLKTAPEEQRPGVLQALIQLSGHNYDEDDDAWGEWAQRLP